MKLVAPLGFEPKTSCDKRSYKKQVSKTNSTATPFFIYNAIFNLSIGGMIIDWVIVRGTYKKLKNFFFYVIR